MINPGKYDNCVLFYRRVVDNSGSRGPTERWISACVKRARVWQVSTVERQNAQAQGVVETTLYNLECRYDEQITSDMIWFWRGKYFNIAEMSEKGERWDRELLIKGYQLGNEPELYTGEQSS